MMMKLIEAVKVIFGLFQTAQQLVPEKVVQLWVKKNGSLAAPQSANSRKSASGLRKFFFFLNPILFHLIERSAWFGARNHNQINQMMIDDKKDLEERVCQKPVLVERFQV